MSIVHTEALSKVYGTTEQPLRALNDITLSVEKGEFVAIMGASGSGKSTLLYLWADWTGPPAAKSGCKTDDLTR